MIPLFGDSMADVQAVQLEGRQISVALQALRLGTSVVLDFGLWGRDERSALRWLAQSAGAWCWVVYVPVDRDVELVRISQRRATIPEATFPMPRGRRGQRGGSSSRCLTPPNLTAVRFPHPPPGWPGWARVGSRPLAHLQRQLTRRTSPTTSLRSLDVPFTCEA